MLDLQAELKTIKIEYFRDRIDYYKGEAQEQQSKIEDIWGEIRQLLPASQDTGMILKMLIQQLECEATIRGRYLGNQLLYENELKISRVENGD